MCFYYQMSTDAQKMEQRFNKKFTPSNQFQSKMVVNGFEFPQMPVVLKNDLTFPYFHWGLIPAWAKDVSIQKYTLNARVETINEKPSFKNVIHQRCLVPSTGFYEWRWLDSKGKNKEKYLIKNQDNELFSFAGLYSEWLDNNTGEIRKTFTLLTTKANSLMAKIHHIKKRMPIIIHKYDEEAWLDGVDYNKFAFPYESKLIAKLI